MGVLKNVVSLASRGSNGISLGQATPRKLLSCAPLAMVSWERSAHSQDITKNMQYISNDNSKLRTDPKTLRLDQNPEKPLCIIINWLLAKHKHIMKYANLYLEQGFDVLSVSCTPWQLLWPMKGSQLVAADLLRFLTANEGFGPMTVHGFSVGGYVWGETCMHAMNNKKLYQPVMDRIVAQVWDSAADISEIRVGVPIAMFPTNKLMQNTTRAYIDYHLRTFHEAATVHYMRASQAFHQTPCRAPVLLLLSRSDPVGAVDSNKRLYDSLTALGIKTTWQCWEKSPHVQHFSKHPKEYTAALYSHLDSANLISQPEKMRLRL